MVFCFVFLESEHLRANTITHASIEQVKPISLPHFGPMFDTNGPSVPETNVCSLFTLSPFSNLANHFCPSHPRARQTIPSHCHNLSNSLSFFFNPTTNFNAQRFVFFLRRLYALQIVILLNLILVFFSVVVCDTSTITRSHTMLPNVNWWFYLVALSLPQFDIKR